LDCETAETVGAAAEVPELHPSVKAPSSTAVTHTKCPEHLANLFICPFGSYSRQALTQSASASMRSPTLRARSILATY